jgi:hypothetical protein
MAVLVWILAGVPIALTMGLLAIGIELDRRHYRERDALVARPASLPDRQALTAADVSELPLGQAA